jgi:alkyl hydroperoxide reductase subunit AhpF
MAIQLLNFDPERINLCPMCDQPIFSYEESSVIISGDCKCLAHTDCVRQHIEENDYEGDDE